MSGKRASLVERYWLKVDQCGSTVRPELGACWRWMGAKTAKENGYGVLGVGGRGAGLVRAHRLSWVIANGPIPDGLFVCHRCDNRECSRPDHLFLGTNEDNVDDMVAKGRNSKPPVHVGAANPRAHILEHDGARRTLTEWERLTGIKSATIRHRLKRGWPVVRALTGVCS